MTGRPADEAILDDEVVNGLTGRQWRALGSYVRFAADRLELRDWTIVLEVEPPPSENAGASIRVMYGRRRAYLRFRDDFVRAEALDQVQTVCHELVHCHLDQVITPVQHGDLRALVGSTAHDVLHAATVQGLEQATDALASAFAPHLPAIDWDYVQASFGEPSAPPWALGPWIPELESSFAARTGLQDANLADDVDE